MRRYSAPFQLVLVISFSLVAATTIGVGTWVISRTIRDYLAEAMTERVDRDMRLAEGCTWPGCARSPASPTGWRSIGRWPRGWR